MFGGVRSIAIAAFLAVCSPLAAAPLPLYQVIDLGTLGEPASQALGINDPGQVIGLGDVPGGTTHAFLWTSGASDGVPTNPQMKDLGTLGGTWSEARGINDPGQVVGYARTSGGLDRAFLWTPGGTDGVPTNPQMKDLDTLGGTTSYARAINDDGQVVGWARIGAFSHAFLWTPGGTDGVVTNPQMKDLGTLGGLTSYATDINNLQRAVGWSLISGVDRRAFIWSGSSGMVNLNTLIPAGSGWTLNEARAVNDVSQIVGHGVSPSGDTHAFLLVLLQPGDTDGDGDVDDDDLFNVKENFGDPSPDSLGDADGDGDCDIDDLVVAKNNFGATLPPGMTFVPEPGGMELSVLLSLALLRRRIGPGATGLNQPAFA